MKKLFSIILALVMCLSVLSFAVADEEIKLVYWSPEDDESAIAVDNAIIEKFVAAHPGVSIELQHGSLSDILAKISAMAIAGTTPDFAFFSPRYVAAMVEGGYLEELTDLYKEIGDIPASFVTPTSSEAIYDIPCVMDSICLYYRTDLFEAAGITPPTNWDEWLAAAEKLTQDTDGDGVNDIFGMTLMGGIPDDYFGFTPILWANGAEFFNADGSAAIDSPAAIEALDFAKKLAEEKGMMDAYNLPTQLEVGGKEYDIRTDYRAILDILAAQNDPDLTDWEKAECLLVILYPDRDSIPLSDEKEAVEKGVAFIDYSIDTEAARRPQPRVMDWEQDAALIIPAVNKVAGREIRAAEYIHWWTFLGWFMEIGDGTFSQVLAIRQKKARGKKLEKYEQEFARNHPELVELKKRISEEQQEEMDNLEKWL